MKKIGEAIKSRRKMLHISQGLLADLSGVGINTLTKIERGEGNPTIGTLSRILDVLGMELKSQIKNISDATGEDL
jgi:y4mF family transcriptional regulator